MGRNKLMKFAENTMRYNVLQPGKPIYEKVKGNWNSVHFKNNNPIVIEVACGRGEYSVGLGKIYPDKNFIGIDLKGDRIWQGSNAAIEAELENVAFLRTHVVDLADFFAEGEVSEIWVVHPDPRPRGKDEKRRLIHPRYLDIYKKILKLNGLVRFKTDNTDLFEYTLEEVLPHQSIKDFEFTRDLYNSALLADHHGITTKYERKFREEGENIKYLKFRFA